MSNLPNWLQGEEPLPPTPPKKSGFNPLVLAGVLFLGCVSIALAGVVFRGISPAENIAAIPPVGTATPAPTFAIPATWTVDPSIPTATIAPTETPAPTAIPEPTQAPMDVLRAALEDKLSVGTRDVPRLARAELTAGIGTLFIDWNINDAMSDETMKSGARIDIVNLLRTVAENDDGLEYEDVALSGFFPLTDGSGNTRDAMVVQVWYDRSALEGIDWNNFFHDDVYGAAKTVRIHDAFEE